MLKKHPKLSVVIPTRERADTLIYTLQTVTSQRYDNLEIIVSDNASEDNTKQIVTGNDDSRIKYINTGARIGMSENWEYGLSHVTGDYVMFLGDDDGLLPNACSDVAEIISKTGTKGIIWNKPNYTWPSVKRFPNKLTMIIKYGLIEMNGGLLLKQVATGRTSYGRLPVIYSGFVSMASINEIKAVTNSFFQCATPDVYSGIVLANKLDTYLYSMRPFSINGGSQHSNGINHFEGNNKKIERFFLENTKEFSPDFPIIPGTISSCVADAFLQAKNLGLVGSRVLNKFAYYENIFNELMAQPASQKLDGIKTLTTLNLPRRLKNRFKVEMESTGNVNASTLSSNEAIGSAVLTQNDGVIRIDCDSFAVKNAYDACQLTGNIFGKYHLPLSINRASYFAYALLAFRRKLDHVFDKYILRF